LFEPKLHRAVVLCTHTTEDSLVSSQMTTCDLYLSPNFAASILSLRHNSSSASFVPLNYSTVISTRRTPVMTRLAAQELTVGVLDTQWPRSGRALAALRRSARVTDASPSRYRAPSSPSSCPPCPCAPVLLVHPLEGSRRRPRSSCNSRTHVHVLAVALCHGLPTPAYVLALPRPPEHTQQSPHLPSLS
jgi:hypothetical protein